MYEGFLLLNRLFLHKVIGLNRQILSCRLHLEALSASKLNLYEGWGFDFGKNWVVYRGMVKKGNNWSVCSYTYIFSKKCISWVRYQVDYQAWLIDFEIFWSKLIIPKKIFSFLDLWRIRVTVILNTNEMSLFWENLEVELYSRWSCFFCFLASS